MSGGATAGELLRSAYDWESARETITLGAAIQRFRHVNGYVGLPAPAKPAFLKVFRRLINGRRPPEEIYRVHDASHVLTGTTFTHDEPPDRKSTRLNSSHIQKSRMPSSA